MIKPWKRSLVTLILMALGIFALSFWPPKIAIADEPTLNPLPISEEAWHRLEPRQYLFLKYPEVAAQLDRVIKCEGNWKMVPNAAGASTAFGYAQFLNGTWLSTRKAMGLSVDLESRTDPYAHIDATVFLWNNGKGAGHWQESKFCWSNK